MTLDILLDVIGIIGLIMIGYGLWLLAPVSMYLGMGFILTAMSLLSVHGTLVIKRPTKKKDKGE